MNRVPSVTGKPRPPPPPYPGPVTRRQPPPLPNSPESQAQPSNLSRFRPDLAAEEQRQPEGTTGKAVPLVHPTTLNVIAGGGDTSFAPAQTSTPNTEQRFLFDSPEDEQNAVVVYPGQKPNGASSGPQPFRLFCTTTAGYGQSQRKEQSPLRQPSEAGSSHSNYCYSNPYRKTAAQSFYENIEDLQAARSGPPASDNSASNSPRDEAQDADGVADTTDSTVIPEGGRDANSIWYEYGCV